jgi:DNA-binding response OmpR family regulator
MAAQRDFSYLLALARRLFSPTRMRVLIVDPDHASAHELAVALPKHYTAVVAGSAAGAFAAIQADPPTLIATEIHLPDGSGIDLLARVHAAPATRRIYLVALGARMSIPEKIAVFQAGADDCLVKPVEPARFVNHVERLTRFHQALESSAS